MVVVRDLSLKVIEGVYCNVKHFYIDEDITVLNKHNEVFSGVLKDINLDNITIQSDNDTVIYFNDIEKIVNTDWLGDEDIRKY